MPPKIFKEEVFAISGKLSQPRKEYEELIKKHGGEIATSLTAAVTFLISTDDDIKACSQKVATAIGRGTPIVQEGFIGACIAAKKLLPPAFFSLKVPAKKRKAPEAKEMSASSGAASTSEAVPRPAKRKAAKQTLSIETSPTAPVIFKSGLADKAGVVQERVSKGFVKATLVWDVELVLNVPEKGKDRYYNMQMLAAKEGDELWVVQHWGRTGLEGAVHVDGPFTDLKVAKNIFRRKFRLKTGNVFGQLGGTFEEIMGKHKLLAKDTKVHAPGLWQYYMHNSVDGKPIGWYNYKGDAAENMEKYWRQFESNAGMLDVRIVQTDYFKYEINFKQMIQTNVKSGTRRAIRRVPPGDKPDDAPPSKIPEAIKPVKMESDGEDDDDEELDECSGVMDSEDEEEDAEAATSAGEAERAKASGPDATDSKELPMPKVKAEETRAKGAPSDTEEAPIVKRGASPSGGNRRVAEAMADAETLPMDAETLPFEVRPSRN